MPSLRIHRLAPVLVLLFVLLAFGFPVSAAEQGPQALSAGSSVEKNLARDFPQAMPDLEGIYPTPIEGLYEVQTGRGLFYYFPDSGHLLVGQLIDKNSRNLTKESIDRKMADKLAKIPLDQAIKIGDGKNTVIEFTDPDCPYCRKAYKFFANRDDITLYVFLYPLQIHPQAEAKSRFILSSDDPAETYQKVLSGKYDDKPLPEFKNNGRLDDQVKVAKAVGIRSTPTFWINGTFVQGANADMFRKLLGAGPGTPRASAPEQTGESQ